MCATHDIKFDPKRIDHIGIEQEFLLGRVILPTPDHQSSPWIGPYALQSRPDPIMLPASTRFLEVVKDDRDAWTYELSACQVEYRTRPHRSLVSLGRDLLTGHVHGHRAARLLDVQLLAHEVAPANMPLDVYPEPRYIELAQKMPSNVLRAACRVTGIHIHYGCRDMQHALRVHRALVRHLHRLMAMGDGSHGQRLKLYRDVAGQNMFPPMYESADAFEQIAHEQGFADNLRNCWHLVRITQHGTVEVRCFGNTSSILKILHWACTVRNIARHA